MVTLHSNLIANTWYDMGTVYFTRLGRSHTQQTRDNNVMHAKSGLRVLLEWKINRPDSVITDVIPLFRHENQNPLSAMVNAGSDRDFINRFGGVALPS